MVHDLPLIGWKHIQSSNRVKKQEKTTINYIFIFYFHRYVQQQIKYEYVQAPSQSPPQVTEPSVEVPPPIQQKQQQQNYEQYVVMAPKQPKSLIDSYVPSYLQVQYYKQQQQAQRNSIQENGKIVSSSITGKTDIVKSQRGSASSYRYQYQIPEN